ncbi:sialic acid-binding Ig-like lectin 15 [Eurytemora carolleeae]|uniref:sialic acid-binding Ig-like lectin 15 n=1 Tax=Eurytemora carolleeae TaxID=1294199 RepID=UPI000C792766|nr:sialic acid-binding Ig-like lectin 15 [Eurytemora carolleeae]|eukprot:XP_023341207.1 sialic acid-binding Ig-like lectin 15 [Eurytemora affinis]
MSCIVAFIEWYHDMPNGTATKIKTARSGDPHTHIIQRVEPNHEGTYTCVAGNVLGKAEASAYLQVYSGSSSSLYSHNAGLLEMLLLMLFALFSSLTFFN